MNPHPHAAPPFQAPSNYSASLSLAKPVVASPLGIVAAQHRRAAEAGAAVMAAGGNAFDAAVATSFALGALEPWMSGMGGGGAMVLYIAAEKRYEVIDFGMRAPGSLRVEDFKLAPAGVANGLFPWPRVQGDINLSGPKSMAVPGVVAGMAQLHARHGSRAWDTLLQPAIDLAEEGLLVDQMTSAAITEGAAALREHASSARVYLRDGLPPSPQWGIKDVVRLPLHGLARTLAMLAREGGDSFYRGALAQQIAADVAAVGGYLNAQDLAAYEAVVRVPLVIPYRHGRIIATPELTAGPTLAHTLAQWQVGMQPSGHAPDSAAYVQYALGLQQAYRARLTAMGDADGARQTGLAQALQLWGGAGLAASAAGGSTGNAAGGAAGDTKAKGGAPSQVTQSPAAPPRADCTTHFCVVDAAGNMVAVTQTLLGIFGSHVVLPETGVLMNNGIMWFDPVAGKPNSLAPGKRCLTNYTPVLGERPPAGAAKGALLGAAQEVERFALGASGGRRILPAVAQLASFLIDYHVPLGEAFALPRIDASEGGTVIGDTRLSSDIQAALAAQFDYVGTHRITAPFKFACPSAVLRSGNMNFGATEVASLWADAVAAGASST
jgi:gamma-glutamyltranspeptidase / glutathione hydrolase